MANVGYARVSTTDQDLSVQIAALKAAGCDVQTDDPPGDFAQGLASSTMLNGVSVALRTLPNPPCVIADDSLAKPA